MDTLIVSQSIFYIVSSLVIVIIGVFLIMAMYQLFRILKNARLVSQDLNETYNKTKKQIMKMISSIFSSKVKKSKK